MITRKELVIALFAFCLAAAIFAVVPVSSVGTYDPWLDYNDDGKIDLKDLYPMQKAYGTFGDPTKNVNVTNLVPSKLDYEILHTPKINMTVEQYGYFINWSGGYSRLMFFARPSTAKNMMVDYQFTLSLIYVYWGVPEYIAYEIPSWALQGQVTAGGTVVWSPQQPLTIVNKAPYIQIIFQLTTTYPEPSNIWVQFDFFAYLRNE